MCPGKLKETIELASKEGSDPYISISQVSLRALIRSDLKFLSLSKKLLKLIDLTKSIAADYSSKGIRCNVICPGTVDTPTWRKRVLSSNNPIQTRKDYNSRQIIGRVAKPEEISDLILFLLSDRSSFVTGSVYNIDGGMSL